MIPVTFLNKINCLYNTGNKWLIMFFLKTNVSLEM